LAEVQLEAAFRGAMDAALEGLAKSGALRLQHDRDAFGFVSALERDEENRLPVFRPYPALTL
jgi:hypothetical protein